MDETLAPVVKRGRYVRLRRIPVPTWRIWMPTLILVGVVCWLMVPKIYPWLAVNEPLPDTKRVIVEGWMPDYALKDSAKTIAARETERVYCTGGPLERGSMVLDYGTYAGYAAETLGRIGVPGEKIVSTPSPAVKTARTRANAAALRRMLDREAIPNEEKRINLITLGSHGRRSREIYREELGPAWEIGVISLPDEEFTPTNPWFIQSSGVKSVIAELLALGLGRLGIN